MVCTLFGIPVHIDNRNRQDVLLVNDGEIALRNARAERYDISRVIRAEVEERIFAVADIIDVSVFACAAGKFIGSCFNLIALCVGNLVDRTAVEIGAAGARDEFIGERTADDARAALGVAGQIDFLDCVVIRVIVGNVDHLIVSLAAFDRNRRVLCVVYKTARQDVTEGVDCSNLAVFVHFVCVRQSD